MEIMRRLLAGFRHARGRSPEMLEISGASEETSTFRPSNGPIAAASRGTIIPRSLFNEEVYLRFNLDVAEAVADGLTTPYAHYIRSGHHEEISGRRVRSVPTQSEPLGMRFNDDYDIYDRLIDLEIEKRALIKALDARPYPKNEITFENLTEDLAEELKPPLDKADCDESLLDDDQLFWRRNGFIVKENFIPHDMIDAYCSLRSRHPNPGGWSCPVPYMHIRELRDLSLYDPLMMLMKKLVGEEMGLHLNCTGWVTTDRNWHQDDYLNPSFINGWYAASWIALDDIHPDCGPFEYVPGSHTWPLMRSHLVRLHLTPEERRASGWAMYTERFVNEIAAAEIEKRGIAPRQFLAKKGDLLIWHGRLMHRGSYANVQNMERKTLISHYSGIDHRIDMRGRMRSPDGHVYFRQDIPLDFDPYRT